MSNGKRGIRRLALAVLTGVLLAGTQEAWAGFFDPCVPPGDAMIVVTEDTTVKNEAAILEDENFDDCTIEVADGVRIEAAKRGRQHHTRRERSTSTEATRAL